MNDKQRIRRQLEKKRAELNKAAAKNLSSEECFRLSLEVDALLEQYLLAESMEQ